MVNEKTNNAERAIIDEKPNNRERANLGEKTIQ